GAGWIGLGVRQTRQDIQFIEKQELGASVALGRVVVSTNCVDRVVFAKAEGWAGVVEPLHACAKLGGGLGHLTELPGDRVLKDIEDGAPGQQPNAAIVLEVRRAWGSQVILKKRELSLKGAHRFDACVRNVINRAGI